MREGFRIRDVVYCHNFDVFIADRRAVEISPDPAESVDPNFDCHEFDSLFFSGAVSRRRGLYARVPGLRNTSTKCGPKNAGIKPAPTYLIQNPHNRPGFVKLRFGRLSQTAATAAP